MGENIDMSMHYRVTLRDERFRDKHVREVDVHEFRILHIAVHHQEGILQVSDEYDFEKEKLRYTILTRLAAAYLDGIFAGRKDYSDPNPLLDFFVTYANGRTSVSPESIVFVDIEARGGQAKEDVISAPENMERFLERAATILHNVLDPILPTLEEVKQLDRRRSPVKGRR